MSVGRHNKAVREFLEANLKELPEDEHQTIKMAVKALLEVVESPKNIEIAIATVNQPIRFLSEQEVDSFVKILEAEKEEAEKNK